MRTKARFPFQNTSLVNLPREIWKDIPGFEGIYKISHYGRVRSLSRRIAMNVHHGGEYKSKELIRKPSLDVKLNKTVNQSIYTLQMCLYKDGTRYYFPVGRLVYHLFGKKFDMNDPTVIISYKDHDGRNVHISNLVKTDRKSVMVSSHKEGRASGNLTALSKPITQFDAEGRVLNTFPSMTEAGRMLSLSTANIATVVSRKGHMYKGFFWKSGVHSKNLDLKKISRTNPRERIHLSLLKRLKLRKIDLDHPPAFLNLSTKSMRGEVWKDVPEYKGLYQVSNFGRVKALQKVTHGKQKKWMPEQIQRLVVDFRVDAKGREVAGSTFIVMAKNGKKTAISISRLVYSLFVKKFDLANKALRVYYKDGNTLNLDSKNLMLKSGVWSINRTKYKHREVQKLSMDK
jgi:hypothetical protein